MRAMFLEFPDDRTTHYLDRQYMLGPSLLVAPVFVPEGEETEYYIPAGCWTSFFHPDRTIQGPTWVKEVIPIDEIPVWVRPGTVLCLGPKGTERPDYALNQGVEVQLYELGNNQSTQTDIPSGKGDKIGATLFAENKEGKTTVKVSNNADSEIATVSFYSKANGAVVQVAFGKEKDEIVF